MIIFFEGPVKTLVVDRLQDYLKFIKSYDDNMSDLLKELRILCAKKLDIEAKVMKDKEDLRVMTRETANWLNNLKELIEREEMKKLMKEERVAEIVVKMIERRVLKKLWKDDREIFDIVVHVVMKKCNQEAIDKEVDAEEDVDYKKVAKIASDVMKDIAEEFKKFIKRDDASVAVVKLLNDVDLEKLKKDGDEMAKILRKAEGIIRQEAEHIDHDEEEVLLPKYDDDVQQVNKSIIKEKVGIWRKHIGSLMTFLDDEKFKKGLPDGAILGLEVMDALSKSPGSEQVKENGKPHRYCGWCVVRFGDYRHRHDMSEIAEVMVKAIKSMIHDCPPEMVTRSIRNDELEIIPGEFIEGLESREELLQKILIALKDNQVNIVGVFGMGGCGKTTLAKEVAYKRVSDLFDKRVIVEVSEAPNIKSIQNQIAGGIGLTLDDMHTIAQRARILYNKLKSEKILIILDNIWKKLKFDEVGIPHKSNKDFCCKLLITTREKQVCRLMDVEEANIFKVGLLNETEALNLFENQTEKKVGSGEFKPVADRLLRKCDGLPLAIATTASALKGKKLSLWCHFAETSEKPISSQVSSEYRETYSILETSYNLIDIEEKRIFLFLACLSPLDSAVKVDDLMRYGIGLDFFQRVNGLSEAMEQANAWANELISSSLLLKGDSDGEVKIHDLVRASAISFIDKGKDRMTLVESIPRWMRKKAFEKFTAISLMSGHDFSRLSGVKAPMLEILLLKGDVSVTTLPSDFFVGMKNLKVLSLSNVNFNLGLPESMGELERLQTLHLHHCKLKDIKLIGKLVNLLVLSLRESSLEEMPIEIGELSNLQLLDMGGCKGVKSIPANILSRLSNLEGLYMLNCFDGWASTNIDDVNEGEGFNQASGSELATLSHLNVLEIDVPKVEQLLTVNNGQLAEQLSKFKIRVGSSSKWDKAEESASRYILELDDIDASQNKWLRALLKKSDCLLVMGCDRLVENFVPQLDEDGFKDLKILEIVNCEVKFIITTNEQDESITAFVNLESLSLRHMKSLEMICDGKAPAGIFSNLRNLFLFLLPDLKHGLPLTVVPPNLTEVLVQYCQSLKFIFEKEASVAENETDTISFPILKSLNLYEVGSLASVVGQSHSENYTIEISSVDHTFFNAKSIFPSLENLKLSVNRTISTLWSKACDVSSFQNLKFLYIGDCLELERLGSPSIFAALVQLEEFTITECPKLEEVITRETEGDKLHVIKFPLLKHLFLKSLPKLERFYGGSYKLEFPNLKSLRLSDAPNFTNFDGSENSTTFSPNKIEFPCLEELDIRNVSKEVVRLWNWSSSDLGGESESGSISLNPVPNLQKLTLGQVHGMTSIPHLIFHKLSHLLVTDFCDINTLFSNVPLNQEVFGTYSQLPNLENLSVDKCDSLEQLFENEDDDDAGLLCRRLVGLTLKTPKLKMLPLHLFKSIRTLYLSKLSWKFVFPANLFIKGREQLQQLESLAIRKCKNLEVIIKDDLVGDEEDRVLSFPHLKSLDLDHLNISNFASKSSTALQFQSLEIIEMTSCRKLQSFCSGPLTAPKLKEVKLLRCGNVQYFVSGEMNGVRELPSLERVDLVDCRKMVSFSSEPLVAPKLRYAFLHDCRKMTCFIRGDPNRDDILELPSLEKVFISGCNDMESFSSGGIKAPNLCELKVDETEYTKSASEELQDMLVNLNKFLMNHSLHSLFSLP
ncbi:uncharacterized protein LOC141613876 isoform X1 [Silene latifolia]|uniref:uncharacterized protein LOC141613876 isoform X1 n=1 Tax=Silene latifolia TaxID=37657 RepID=UPI003D77D770